MPYPENELELLRADFAYMTEVPAPRIMRFLETGAGDVLDELTRVRGKISYNHAMELDYDSSRTWNLRYRFFRETTIEDPAFFYRLAAVYSSFFGPDAARRAKITIGGHALDPFLLTSSGGMDDKWSEMTFRESAFKAEIVERMLQVAGEPAGKLARFVLCNHTDDVWNTRLLINAALALNGFAGYAARHPEVIAEALAHRDFKVRMHVLAVMLGKRIDPTPFVERITALATGGSKQVRERAEPLLRRVRSPEPEATVALPPVPEVEDPELPGSVRETMKRIAKPADAARAGKIFAAMQPGAPFTDSRLQHDWYTYDGTNGSPLHRIARLPEVRLTHVLRLLANERLIHDVRGGKPVLERHVFPDAMTTLAVYRKAHGHAYTTRELAAAFEHVRIHGDAIGWGMVHAVDDAEAPAEWCGSGVEEYFAERPSILEEVFSGYEPQRLAQRRNALALLGTFRAIPRGILDRVWSVALTGDASERTLARNLLAREEGYFAQVLAALSDPRPEARTNAADWLTRIGGAQAIEPLRAAMRKERSEVTRNAFIAALERLGADLDDLVDRDALLAEAAKGMKSGPPGALSWFDFDALPDVRWRDGGEAVDPLILRWLIVQAFKGKSPEPSPLLRRRAAAFDPSGREALGRSVLETWIAQDEPEPQPSTGVWTYAPAKSAIREKGILAVAGACAGATAPPIVQRYLKKWFGNRAPQCKALIRMLAWIDHPSATQLLLATANRFRTAGIREEAEACVNEIAERKGWTLDELADRTIPAIGFEDSPEMVLDYGTRKFLVRLGPDFELVIRTEDGRTIKSLPDARAGESEEQVQEAKKTLADAKKQLKPMLAAQKERLYEAMCTQRTWRFADWDTYLNRHPVISRYCQSLVWQVAGGTTFRPLGDGTLTGPNDRQVLVEPGTSIRVAHACTIPAGVAEAWKKQFDDYDVLPLFEQFRSEQFTPPSDGNGLEIDAFEGHMIEAFKLRGRATKLGYTRGGAGDGGWFFEYRKAFPGLGVEAVIGFSGNGLPEDNRTVALTQFSFVRGMAKIPLREVPPVLVSETWNDVKQIASLGTGFDPDWENKTAV